MEMSNTISVGGVILMGIKSASLTSLVSITIFFMLLCWVIELYDDFYSSIVQPSRAFIYVTCKRFSKSKQVKNVVMNPHSSETKYLFREEVELVMERLGLDYNTNCDKYKLQEKISSHEIANMFNVNEPSIGEVQQAFDLFDENRDGYIDKKELVRVLKRLGLQNFSERECRTMITRYDHNGDGLIDFCEFCELVEDSFC